jgi:hypothetical protein
LEIFPAKTKNTKISTSFATFTVTCILTDHFFPLSKLTLNRKQVISLPFSHEANPMIEDKNLHHAFSNAE